jgi:hypothetical protein
MCIGYHSYHMEAGNIIHMMRILNMTTFETVQIKTSYVALNFLCFYLVLIWTFYKASSVCSYRVCELLYEKRKDYAKILRCYLFDQLRRPQVFSYLRKILVNPGYVDLEVTQQQMLENIEVGDWRNSLFMCTLLVSTVKPL